MGCAKDAHLTYNQLLICQKHRHAIPVCHVCTGQKRNVFQIAHNALCYRFFRIMQRLYSPQAALKFFQTQRQLKFFELLACFQQILGRYQSCKQKQTINTFGMSKARSALTNTTSPVEQAVNIGQRDHTATSIHHGVQKFSQLYCQLLMIPIPSQLSKTKVR
jgi:hypothetical protein